MNDAQPKRKVTLRAILTAIIHLSGVREIVFVGNTFLFLILLPTYFMFVTWNEIEEKGEVTSSTLRENWFGSYYYNEFSYFDKNGNLCEDYSFSKEELPLGIVTLEYIDSDEFTLVRIQGTDAGFLKNYWLISFFEILLAITVLLILLPLGVIATIIHVYRLRCGILTQVRVETSGNEVTCNYLVNNKHYSTKMYVTHSAKKKLREKKIQRAYVNPKKPKKVTLWAVIENFWVIRPATETVPYEVIDVVPSKNWRRFKTLFRLKIRDYVCEFPRFVRENFHSPAKEMHEIIMMKQHMGKLKGLLTLFILSLLWWSPTLFPDILPNWETVSENATLEYIDCEKEEEKVGFYTYHFSWLDSHGEKQFGESFSERKLPKTLSKVEKWGEHTRLAGTWSRLPNRIFLKFAILLVFIPLGVLFLFLCLLLELAFRFLDKKWEDLY